MAGITLKIDDFFPIKKCDDVIELFKWHLLHQKEPNLTFLSVVLGALESFMTANRPSSLRQRSSVNDEAKGTEQTGPISYSHFPCVQLSMVEALYEQFVIIVKSSVDLTYHTDKYTSRALLKKVSDVIWNLLTRTFYKETAHLQTVFTLLTERKLNCFGMAFAVVSACQVLGLDDVHLALSEDHAWAVFGDPKNPETAEITWHGKGCEDKRGQPVVSGAENKSWLYLSPIVCNRQMEVAAMVAAINPSISVTTDCLDLASLQQKLLWVLYDHGHLAKYPTSLATLADLEEMYPTAGRSAPLELYQLSIDVAKQYYENSHVYPYTYIGNYHYRRCNYKEALSSWAQGATVISRYNYGREDEEIYKEFVEIANEFIPNVMRLASGGGDLAALPVSRSQTGSTETTPIIRDSECYGYILQFYDGLCKWEEGSSTPVLHITWATHALYSLNRFDASARSNLTLKCDPNKPKEKDEPNDVDVPSEAASGSDAGSLEKLEAKTANPDPVSGHCVVLYSKKMMDMKDLLVSDKLNSGAIKLLLTAQSQVDFKQRAAPDQGAGNGDFVMYTELSRKRVKRE